MGKRAGANIIPEGFIQKDHFEQVDARAYVVNPMSMRVHDSLATPLPASAASDDIGLDGAFGSVAPKLTSGDAASTSVTRYARFNFVLPPEYVAGETVTLRCITKMGVVANGSATIDAQVYKNDNDGTISADLCATSAINVNANTSVGNRDFTITSTDLSPGDVLDVRLTAAITDSGTPSGVTMQIYSTQFLLDVKG